MTVRKDKMTIYNYPRKFRNRRSGQVFKAMPWWEAVKEGEIEQVNELGLLVTEAAGRLCKFGIITQVGYLLENEHGVWFGLGANIVNEKEFEDLGEWKEDDSQT